MDSKIDLKKNNIKISMLNETGCFDDYKILIEHEVLKALGIINSKLEITNVEIILKVDPMQAPPGIGLGGCCQGTDVIYLSFNPNEENFVELIKKNIIRTLAHESHHLNRHRESGPEVTLFEHMVSEGLADHFEIEITGEQPQPWSIALSEEDLKKYINLAKSHFQTEFNPNNHSKWFFGTTEEIPLFSGYSIGFEIIKKYLFDNPHIQLSKNIDISYDEILAAVN